MSAVCIILLLFSDFSRNFRVQKALIDVGHVLAISVRFNHDLTAHLCPSEVTSIELTSASEIQPVKNYLAWPKFEFDSAHVKYDLFPFI